VYNVYRCVHRNEPITVGIREFRENLAEYLLESNAPVAITRQGDTIGYFIPARRKRSEADRTALKEAAAQLDALLAAKSVTEDELVADFKRWRAAKRK
jgi:PHD/YefM family antitoxin component YafN of YafNO toxin-antitoxin module